MPRTISLYDQVVGVGKIFPAIYLGDKACGWFHHAVGHR